MSVSVPVNIGQLHPVAVAALSDDEIYALYERPQRSAPWLRANFVSSVDGAATVGGVSGALGNAADQRVFDILRELSDVVIVGAGTVRGEGYGPMVLGDGSVERRTARGLAPHPVFAIVSNSLDLDPDSRIFSAAPVRAIIVTTAAAPRERLNALAAVADIVIAGTGQLEAALMKDQLAARGLTQQLCEGGPSLFGTVLVAGAVDELCLTMSPQLVAGDAMRIASGLLPASAPVTLAHVLVSQDTLLLRYETRAGE